VKWKLSYRERLERANNSSEYRQELFKSLLLHLSEGYSLDSWSGLNTSVLLGFLEKYPEDMPKDAIDNAIVDGKDCWERLGMRQADGSCMGNSRTWYYNMSNRYGWRDKVDVKSESSGQVQVNVVNYARKSRDAEGSTEA
jgi:hypothetical protein